MEKASAMKNTTLHHPARRVMLAQTLAHSATLAVGSLFGAEAIAASAANASRTGAADIAPNQDRKRSANRRCTGRRRGSAGAVMAARLSEKASRNVLLLEAGHNYAAWDYPHVIASSDIVGGDTRHEWGIARRPAMSITRSTHCAARCSAAVRRSTGRCHSRAAAGSENWNLPGWSFEEMLPSFRRLEHRDNDSVSHGQAGRCRCVN